MNKIFNFIAFVLFFSTIPGHCSQDIIDTFMGNVTIQLPESGYQKRVTDVFKVSFGDYEIRDYPKFLKEQIGVLAKNFEGKKLIELANQLKELIAK